MLLNSESDFTNKINSLNIQKQQSIANGDYIHARELKTKIETIITGNKTEQNKTLWHIQQKEDKEWEAVFHAEWANLHDNWDSKVKDFIARNQKIEHQLNEQHTIALKEQIYDFSLNYPSIKYSKEYLESRQNEVNCAKTEKFTEANSYKNHCERLMKSENERYAIEKNSAIQKKIKQWCLKQEQEKTVWKEKIERQLEVWYTLKEKEINTWITKYKNKKHELDAIHKQQIYITNNDNIIRAKATSNRIDNTWRRKATSRSKINNSLIRVRYPHMSSVKNIGSTTRNQRKDSSSRSNNNNNNNTTTKNWNDKSEMSFDLNILEMKNGEA